MKKVLILACVSCVIVIIGLCGASWHFSNQLLYPRPGKCNKKHFIFCGGASQIGIPHEDITFRSRDGLTLSGWYFPANGAHKAIIMIHGITADRHEMLRWVKSLHNSGFNLLLYDQRNHGKSGKSVSGMGMLEKDDIPAAIDFLINDRGNTSIGIFGVSMGAATAIPAMAQETRITAGVFEASFADLRDLLSDIARRDLGLPSFPLLNITALLFRLRSGIDMSSVKPEAHIGLISPRPVLIMHCTGDDYINPSHGERIYKAAREPREIWRAGCKKHAEAWQGDPAGAERRVSDFFKKNVRPENPSLVRATGGAE
jgi:uncharacterized protein